VEAAMTKFCRFNENRLGVVEGDYLIDVTQSLALLPKLRWPFPTADLFIEKLANIRETARSLSVTAPRVPRDSARIQAPIANPPKVIAAPVNYLRHQAEAIADGGKSFDKDVKTIEHYGLFLKSTTSVIGPDTRIPVPFPERRMDHELELVVVIGKRGRNIPQKAALSYVAGYTIGLDMTLRGPEDRSLRKSLDGFSVLGPYLVTTDEIANPNDLKLELRVNGALRQHASTRDLIFSVEQLIAYASAFYTLFPGDVIYTGTPEGVGPVQPGDQLSCAIEGLGQMTVLVGGD
jgi:2,4-didehydro-3-deoxy-L-rhamnonate hydrolase